jgi:hypothetical protein
MRDTQLGIDYLFEASGPGAWLCSPKHKVDVLYLDAHCKEPSTPNQVKTGDLVRQHARLVLFDLAKHRPRRE